VFATRPRDEVGPLPGPGGSCLLMAEELLPPELAASLGRGHVATPRPFLFPARQQLVQGRSSQVLSSCASSLKSVAGLDIGDTVPPSCATGQGAVPHQWALAVKFNKGLGNQ